LTIAVPTEGALVVALSVAILHYAAYIIRPHVILYTVDYYMGYGILPYHRLTTCLVVYVEC
jgi:hypothetical protein